MIGYFGMMFMKYSHIGLTRAIFEYFFRCHMSHAEKPTCFLRQNVQNGVFEKFSSEIKVRLSVV